MINDLAIKPPPPPVVKNPPTNAQDPGTIPGPGRSHKIPHGATRPVPPKLLKPTSLDPTLCNRRIRSPRTPTREQPPMPATTEKPAGKEGTEQPKINK